MKKITRFVADNIGDFHATRLANMKRIKLVDLLKRCNPYLCRAKNLVIAQDFVRSLFDARLTHGEQTVFGEFLEELAIFSGEKVYGAKKSGIEGMDLEFVRDGVHYVVSVKSGPNWGNSSAVKKQVELFNKATKTIRQSRRASHPRPVLGCCFGKRKETDRGVYDHYCGQKFWDFLSGDDRLYIDIIEPLGHEAKERNQAFVNEYGRCLNLLTADFIKRYCVDGGIDWEVLVKFNSEHEEPKK
ncbi:MAG: PmeII family type II restriction endonuclease [Gammaproteobacteria bacterium]